ncbi:MAG: bifunctional YncE family protein/alkaline phosphatase family protein [Bryobacteraceae bacterium]
MADFTVIPRKPQLYLVTGLAFASFCRDAGNTQESAALKALLPTGKRITPTAAPGSHFQMLNPGLKAFPNFVAGQAISTAVSPDQKTLLILTSGFNRINGADGNPIPDASEEYVFVYDISHVEPQQIQVVKVPDTFAGLAFSPDSKEFYVSGGKDDDVHIFASDSKRHWSENGEPIKLGHPSGLGLQIGKEPLAAGGLAVTQNGEILVVANVYNDSISVVDLHTRRVSAELDLRPGKIDAAQAGVPGGEYPFWVSIKGNTIAYVSSLRDREIVVVSLGPPPTVLQRMKIAGSPNKMLLNRDQSRLFVTADNSDTVVVVNTKTNRILESLSTVAPASVMVRLKRYTGSAPNSIALSPDEHTLYVTNGASNSVAVIRLGRDGTQSRVTGLLPTGWYPNSVSVSGDGRMLYIVNGKSVPGPNRDLHLKVKTVESHPGPAVTVNSRNQYILQMEKAGFLSVPVPAQDALDRLTRIVAENNSFEMKSAPRDAMVMSELHKHIKHVIYIIKENRTYDQILGDLDRGNGDPSLTEFGDHITPNFHNIARQFVDLDNFYDSGEVSGDGWPWSTSARESDFGEKAVVLQYANRGTNYEYEGLNRDINVGLKTLGERKAANPKTPPDPDLLPGAINVAEPDGPDGSSQGKGYIWDAVLRAGLKFREYGCMSDTTIDAPREPYPFKARVIVSRPANPELYKYGDPYFRGFDPGYPDFYREAEWEREFNQYVANNNLPAFEIVQLPVDHMGEFETAISGVNTPELQQADNDYATARLIERVAHSPYKDSTLIFSIEDDAQDGPDHLDAHRTTAYVVGPYVKHGAVVSSYYTTVNMIRTIEDVLGLEHLNLNTATERPMTDVFDLKQKDWTFDAVPSAVLGNTKLPIADSARKTAQSGAHMRLAHDAAYWAAKTNQFDFRGEDRVDAQEFNRIIWQGLMSRPYPTERSQFDLRLHREKLLQ